MCETDRPKNTYPKKKEVKVEEDTDKIITEEKPEVPKEIQPAQKAITAGDLSSLIELIKTKEPKHLLNPRTPGRTILHDAVAENQMSIVK